MSRIFVEALQDYLRGREWRQSVEIFIHANCRRFRHCAEFSHEHYRIFKAFQEVVEVVLENAISCVGGSMDVLEEALEKLASEPPSGPRDEILKEILARLLTYESFEEFSAMMQQTAQNTSLPAPASYRFVDSLMSLGFSNDLICSVLDECADDISLEEIVMKLSESHFMKESQSQNNNTSSQTHQSSKMNSSNCLEAFVRFMSDQPNPANVADSAFELHTKFVSAESMLEGLDEDESGALSEWANGMIALAQAIERAFSMRQPFAECRVRLPTGEENAKSLYLRLEGLRRTADEGGNVMLSDRELRRMAELNAIALMGSEDEQLLHKLITRNDEVLAEIAALHKSISVMTRPGSDVNREKLEELYLYLKEKVASGGESGIDMDLLANEMHDQVYSIVPAQKCSLVVNILLDLHVEEEEQIWLRQRIKEMTNSSPQRNSSDNGGSKSDVAADSMPSWDSKYEANFVGIQPAESKASASFGASSVATDISNDATQRAESKSSAASAIAHTGILEGSTGTILPPAESKTLSNSPSFRGGSFETVNLVGPHTTPMKAEKKVSTQEDSNSTQYLDELKAKHQATLENLRKLLDVERSQRLQQLEEKLLRRKMALKKSLAGGELTPTESREMEKDLANLETRLEQDSASISQHFDKLKEGLCNGVKKLALCELKMAKSSGCSLTEEEQRYAREEAARTLKERHERDQLALFESLAAERSRQRDALKARLEAGRLKLLRSSMPATEQNDALHELETQYANDIQTLQSEIADQQSQVIEANHRDLILALSALQMNDTLLRDSNHKEIFEEEDELFSRGNDTWNLSQWVNAIDSTSSSFLAAERSLLGKVAQTAGDDADVDCHIGVHLSSVITNAFCKQLEECGSSSRKIPNGLKLENISQGEMDKLKASILDEFERSRDVYEAALERSREKSRNRLNNRKASALESKTESTSEADVIKVQARLDSIVDSFLKDPLTQKASEKADPIVQKAAGVAQLPPARGAAPDYTMHNSYSNENNFAEKKDKLLAVQADAEKSLTDELQLQMTKKRRALEQKLQKTREKRRLEAKSCDMEESLNEEQFIENDIQKTEEVFAQVSHLLKTAPDNTVLAELDSSAVHDLIERFSRDETIHSIDDYIALMRKDDERWNDRRVLDKEALQDKVKQISASYSEEKQKLDLMMKIQQARQRALLQRKLLERKQQAAVVSDSPSKANKLASGLENRGLHLGPLYRK